MLYSFSKGITSTVFAMFLADGVVDLDAPERALAIAFLTTDSPKPSEGNTVRIRNTVTDRVVYDINA